MSRTLGVKESVFQSLLTVRLIMLIIIHVLCQILVFRCKFCAKKYTMRLKMVEGQVNQMTLVSHNTKIKMQNFFKSTNWKWEMFFSGILHVQFSHEVQLFQ